VEAAPRLDRADVQLSPDQTQAIQLAAQTAVVAAIDRWRTSERAILQRLIEGA
jgi:hypothetical protein